MSSLATSLQPVDWNTIECCLHDWVTDKLSFDTDRVIWEDQNITQPRFPYISMKRISTVKEGGVDETRATTDLAQDAGEEIELLTTGPIAFTLTVQAHIDEQWGANKPGGNATFLLSKLRASLGQRSVCDAFTACGLSVIEELAINDISLVFNGQFINRASMDVRLRTASVMTERVGYIDKVDIESTDLGIDFTVDAS